MTFLSPWCTRGAWRMLAATSLGCVVVLVAWFLSGREVTFGAQVKWADLGVAGFVVAASSQARWVLNSHRLISQRRDLLLVRLVPEQHHSEADTELVFAAAGLVFVHRPGCALAIGRELTSMTRDEAMTQGRRVCGVCRP